MCEAECPASPSASPRLRVSHLLLGTTICALTTAIIIAWYDWDQVPTEIHRYARAEVLYRSLLYGIAISGMLIFFWRHWRYRESWARMPGHWLLLFIATTAMLHGFGGVTAWLYSLGETSINGNFYAWNVEKIVLCTSVGANCLIFSRVLTGNIYWKALLLFPGCILFLLVPQHFYALNGVWRSWFSYSHAYAQILVSAIVLLSLTAAIRRDRPVQEQGDWLHVTGIGVTYMLAAGGLVSAIGWLTYYG